MSDKSKEQLLAWYANGTLDEQQRVEVEAWLATDPEARLQLAEFEFIQQSVAEVGEEEPGLDTEAGLSALMGRIDAEEAANQSTADANQAGSTGLLQRLAQWLQWNLTPPVARLAMVSQFAVVLALGALLWLPGAEEQPDYQTLSGSTQTALTEAVLLDIGVEPQTTLAEFQALLQAQQASIIQGPNSIGIYRIQLPPDADTQAGMSALKATPGVIYLERVVP